jgi:hypothetical protein
MAHPYHLALLSVKKHGVKPEDCLPEGAFYDKFYGQDA